MLSPARRAIGFLCPSRVGPGQVLSRAAWALPGLGRVWESQCGKEEAEGGLHRPRGGQQWGGRHQIPAPEVLVPSRRERRSWRHFPAAAGDRHRPPHVSESIFSSAPG